MWIPRNKKTGVEYPPISKEKRDAWERHPQIAGKYQYIPVEESPAPVPKKKPASKKAEAEDK
jgi:hypothetical protein